MDEMKAYEEVKETVFDALYKLQNLIWKQQDLLGILEPEDEGKDANARSVARLYDTICEIRRDAERVSNELSQIGK